MTAAMWMPETRPDKALRHLYLLSAPTYPVPPALPPWHRLEHHNELDPAVPVWLTGRPRIGDAYLGAPAVRCEMPACRIVHRGGFNTGACWRAALAAGWRLDWIGRRACPRCQQNRPVFWRPPATPDLPVVWDADAAVRGIERMLPPLPTIPQPAGTTNIWALPEPAPGPVPQQQPRRRHRKDTP